MRVIDETIIKFIRKKDLNHKLPIEKKKRNSLIEKGWAIILFAEKNRDVLFENDDYIEFESEKNSDTKVKIKKGINPGWKINVEIEINISNLRFELSAEDFSPMNILLMYSTEKSVFGSRLRIKEEHFEDEGVRKNLEVAIEMAKQELFDTVLKLKDMEGLTHKEILDIEGMDFEDLKKFSKEKEKLYINKEIPEILIKTNMRKDLNSKLVQKESPKVNKI